MKIIKKTLAIILGISILLTTGCQSSSTSWVYELDGTRIPSGLYINYMIYALSDVEQAEIDAHANEEGYTSPSLKDLLKMSTDGVVNSELVTKEAQLSAAEYFAIEQKSAEYGIEITDGDMESVKTYTSYILGLNPDFYASNGIGESSLLSYEISDMKRSLLFFKLYAEGGEKEVPVSELKTQFNDQYIKVDMMYIEKETGEEGAKTDNMPIAEEYLNRYKNGETFVDLTYDYALSLAETEEEKAAVVKQAEGSSMVIVENARSENNPMIAEFAAAALDSSGIFVYEDYYCIFERFSLLDSEEDFADYKDQLLYAYKADEFNADIRSLAEEILPTLTVNDSAVKAYTPEKIKAV